MFRVLIASLAVLACAGYAQSDSRAARIAMNKAMQDAYRDWRQADPNLEADAAIEAAAIGARADRVAALAGKYFAARKTYFETMAGELRPGEDARPALELANAPVEPLLRGELKAVERNLNLVPNDADPGFQELRRALEREQAALRTLSALPSSRTPSVTSLMATALPAGAPRTRERYVELAARLSAEGQETEKLATAWASYYRALADGAREAVVASDPVLLSSSEPAREPAAPSPEESTALGAMRSTSPEMAPVARYIGEWVYPTTGEHYHGAHPESVEFVVQEEDGRMTGVFHGKFRLPPNAKTDPSLDFTFAGPFQNTHSQSFTIGGGGTLELIPAAAANLLEILFTLPGQAAKITRGNFFLVRK